MANLDLPQNQPIVDSKGSPNPWFATLLRDVIDAVESNTASIVATAQASADAAAASASTAQSSATAAATSAANASLTAAFLEYPSGKNVQWYDAGAGYPAGDPDADLVITARDNTGTQIATMTVRGSLTTSSGNIALSVQSESATATYAIDEVFAGSGTQSATATITVTLPDASTTVGILSWSSNDISVGGEFVSY